MKYLTYYDISEADYRCQSHRRAVDRFVEEYRKDSEIIPERCHSGRRAVNLSEFNYDDLSAMHFHYSHKNNGFSIEREGLISQIGDNSKEIDEEEAIYFSVGLEAVLHNWDIWLKWRTNRFCNPRAAGVKCSTDLNQEHSSELWRISLDWMKCMSSKLYRDDWSFFDGAFEYEKIELSRSNYYALTIVPGIDYPEKQFDPKKALISVSEYAKEIYGVGVSTHLDNEYAEQWNRSTELGKKARISPDNVWPLIIDGKDDALSILAYLYARYIEHCEQTGETPADFALLPKFLKYCQS